MNNFNPIFILGLKRRLSDFFILAYNLIFPLIMVLLLGYLTSSTYTHILSSYSYYSIVLIPFFLLLSITTCAYNAKEESLHKVAGRFLISPTSIRSLVFAKCMSSFIILTLSSTLLLILCNLFFHTYSARQVCVVAFLYMSILFMTTTIGHFIGFSFNNTAIRNYLSLPISIFAFLGGSFFPVGSMNTPLSIVYKLSPLYWINRSVLLYIYDRQPWLLIRVILVVNAVGLLFLILSPITFKREVYPS